MLDKGLSYPLSHPTSRRKTEIYWCMGTKTQILFERTIYIILFTSSGLNKYFEGRDEYTEDVFLRLIKTLFRFVLGRIFAHRHLENQVFMRILIKKREWY